MGAGAVSTARRTTSAAEAKGERRSSTPAKPARGARPKGAPPRPARPKGAPPRPAPPAKAARPAKPARPAPPAQRTKGERHAGTVALLGRPNVGKSTLLNGILGAHLAITSHHPQTTRDRIAGILTTPKTQFVFLDTPGLHKPKNRLGQRMNDVATGTAEEADVILFVTDVAPFPSAEVRPEDKEAWRTVPSGKPVILVLNKIDRVAEKQKLLDVLTAYGAMHDFAAIVPISAKKRDGTQRLLDEIAPLLPKGEPLYPEDELSDRPVRFFVAELVREQVLMRTRQEVPHGVAVIVDAFEEGKKMTRITLSVHVAKESHKGIIIGQGGKMLASIGTAARERTERLLEQKVHLDIRVKTTPGWFDDAARLVDLGYAAEGGKPKQKTKRKGERRPGGEIE